MHAVTHVHLLHGAKLVDNAFALGVITSQRSVLEEIEGVQSVSGAAHLHFAGLLGGGDRSQVGLDVFLPQTEPGEDVRGHVHRVRRCRRDQRITTRGGECERGELGRIATVDQVMGSSRVVGLFVKELLQNRDRLLLIGECIVAGRSCSQQRECIESGCFVIVGECAIDLLH